MKHRDFLKVSKEIRPNHRHITSEPDEHKFGLMKVIIWEPTDHKMKAIEEKLYFLNRIIRKWSCLIPNKLKSKSISSSIQIFYFCGTRLQLIPTICWRTLVNCVANYQYDRNKKCWSVWSIRGKYISLKKNHEWKSCISYSRTTKFGQIL